ncbi:MAG: hypothetical protein EBS06_08625 [Proteobacteria bacterium]|nr:hypothetical protein [Pseudomonadota bacterium]
MSKSTKPKIVFNYQKSNEYKNYHIDGVFGGVLPTTNVWFDVFIEKRDFPKKVECELDVKTGVLTEVKQSNPVKDNEILRELQAGFTMSLDTAKTVRNWLDEKIKLIESELEAIKQKK